MIPDLAWIRPPFKSQHWHHVAELHQPKPDQVLLSKSHQRAIKWSTLSGSATRTCWLRLEEDHHDGWVIILKIMRLLGIKHRNQAPVPPSASPGFVGSTRRPRGVSARPLMWPRVTPCDPSWWAACRWCQVSAAQSNTDFPLSPPDVGANHEPQRFQMKCIRGPDLLSVRASLSPPIKTITDSKTLIQKDVIEGNILIVDFSNLRGSFGLWGYKLIK